MDTYNYIYIYLYVGVYVYTCIHIWWENKIVLVSLSERTMGGGRGKENVKRMKKCWNNTSIYKYNIIECTIL
jgi:hypothetical protein